MPIKLKRVLKDCTAVQAVEWYHTVFSDESDTDIFNFHHEPLGLSVYNFENRVNFLDELDEHVYYIFNSRGYVVGYTCAYEPRWSQFKHGREFGIFIKNKYRGKGYGTDAIKQLELLYTAPYVLSPLTNNVKAITLYERLNYTNTNIIVDKMYLMFKTNLDS